MQFFYTNIQSYCLHKNLVNINIYSELEKEF